jgi:hypothetical protein
MREALRAIVGEKGLIEDEHGKQPFVTDWRGLLVGGAGAVPARSFVPAAPRKSPGWSGSAMSTALPSCRRAVTPG